MILGFVTVIIEWLKSALAFLKVTWRFYFVYMLFLKFKSMYITKYDLLFALLFISNHSFVLISSKPRVVEEANYTCIWMYFAMII